MASNKFCFIFNFSCLFVDTTKKTNGNLLSNIEECVLKKQLQELCSEMDKKDKKIKYLENINRELQETQSKLV